MYLILSSSLHPTSRSRILAKRAEHYLREAGESTRFLDLRDVPVPFCDGAAAYAAPNVQVLTEAIVEATGILIATPIYNYDVNATVKNVLELTGRNWTGKAVGFLCAAGGKSSYMSVMAFANSLMLDFRCVIVPRFVYTDGDAFDAENLTDETVDARIRDLTRGIVVLAPAAASLIDA